MADTLREIATPDAYKVLEKRRLTGKLGPEPLDSTNRRLYALASYTVGRERFMADRTLAVDSDQAQLRGVR